MSVYAIKTNVNHVFKKTRWQSDLADHACSSSLKFTVYIVILLILSADLVFAYISRYWLSIIIKDIY